MNIISSTKTITVYALELSETDAAQCFVAPYEFAERIGAQLRAAGVVPAESNGHHKVGANHPLGFKAHAARKAKAAKAGRPNGKGLLRCPQCPKTFKNQGWLNSHLTKAHSQASPASAAESASTN